MSVRIVFSAIAVIATAGSMATAKPSPHPYAGTGTTVKVKRTPRPAHTQRPHVVTVPPSRH